MKKIIILSIVFVLFPINAFCESWEHVTGDIYIDTDSISCEENICRAWTRLTNAIESKEGVKGFEIYDCKEKKFELLQMLDIDSSGKVLFQSKKITDLKWKYIVPDTLEEKKSSIICEHAKMKK